MFTHSDYRWACFVFRALILLGLGLVGWVTPGVVRGQIFVSDYGPYSGLIAAPGPGPGRIGEYDALTGAAINEALISGFDIPGPIVVSGSNLYVESGEYDGYLIINGVSSSVGLYSTSGSASATFSTISGIQGKFALSGSDIFVVSSGISIPVIFPVLPEPQTIISLGLPNIEEFDAGTGAEISGTFATAVPGSGEDVLAASSADILLANSGQVTFTGTTPVERYSGTIGQFPITGGTGVSLLLLGVGNVQGMTVSGSSLYVCGIITPVNSLAGTTGSAGVGVYDATTGAEINPLLIGGLNSPVALTVSGSDLYVADNGNGTVGEYDATTGSAVNSTLISGLSNAQGVAVAPEVSTAPAAGKYTLLLAAANTSGTAPSGTGYGTMVIGAKDEVIFAGRLPDGEAFSMTGIVTGTDPYEMKIDKTLSYPFVSSGTGKSLLSGTLVFANVAGGCDLSGKITWIKRAQTRGAWRGAIDTYLNVIGSRYMPPGRTGSLLPDFVGGTLELSDTGTLNTSGTGTISKNVILTVNNTVLVVDPGASKLEVRTNPASGVFSGTFLYPVPGKKPVLTDFGGVFFQDQRMGGGFFLGPGGSGTVNLTGP